MAYSAEIIFINILKSTKEELDIIALQLFEDTLKV